MATEETKEVEVAEEQQPHRIVLSWTAYGTFDELAGVIDAVQDFADDRGLFSDFAMMNAMPLDEARALSEDSPMHEFLPPDDGDDDD